MDTYENILDVTYIIIGDEVGASGTHHHQGYVYFNNKISFKQAQKLLPEGCHIEPARGTPKQASDYCKKEKILYEHGELPIKGKRSDIETVKDLIAKNSNINTIIDNVNSYQAIKCAELLMKYKERKRDWKPIVYWFWGPPETGKTRTAFEMCPNPWISGKSLKWWDGYDGHEDVIFDDFRSDFCTYHELLRILDRYPYQVENKGGSRQLLAKRIIITCPFKPEDTFVGNTELISQLLRRIDEIRLFK